MTSNATKTPPKCQEMAKKCMKCLKTAQIG